MPDLSVGSGTSANPGRGASIIYFASLWPWRQRSDAFPAGSHPWRPIWGSVIHHLAGSPLLWKAASSLLPPPPPPPSVCQTHFPPSLLLPWIFLCIKNKQPRLVWRGEVAGVAAWIEIFPLSFGAVSSATDPSPLGPDWSSRWLQRYLIYSRSAGLQLA